MKRSATAIGVTRLVWLQCREMTAKSSAQTGSGAQGRTLAGAGLEPKTTTKWVPRLSLRQPGLRLEAAAKIYRPAALDLNLHPPCAPALGLGHLRLNGLQFLNDGGYMSAS